MDDIKQITIQNDSSAKKWFVLNNQFANKTLQFKCLRKVQ